MVKADGGVCASAKEVASRVIRKREMQRSMEYLIWFKPECLLYEQTGIVGHMKVLTLHRYGCNALVQRIFHKKA